MWVHGAFAYFYPPGSEQLGFYVSVSSSEVLATAVESTKPATDGMEKELQLLQAKVDDMAELARKAGADAAAIKMIQDRALG